jgi:hypothetical protein
VVDATVSGLQKTRLPFDFGAPPHALPGAAFEGALDEPVTAKIVSIGYNFMALSAVLWVETVSHERGETSASVCTISCETLGHIMCQ